MSITLDKQAQVALTDPDFETEPGYCEKFVRQCIQALYGPRFDQYHKEDAKSSARAWSTSKYAVSPHHGSIVGDILYYADRGKHGHVVIRIPNNLVAENSVVHHNGVHGGKGKRKLEELGTPTLIVRLPPFDPQRK